MEILPRSVAEDDEPEPPGIDRLRADLAVAYDIVTKDMSQAWMCMGWAEARGDYALRDAERKKIVDSYVAIKMIFRSFLECAPDHMTTTEDATMLEVIHDEIRTCEMLENKLKLTV